MRSVKDVIVLIFVILAYVLGFIALMFDLYCAYHIIGFWGIVIGLFVFPVLMAAIPLYMLFKYGVLLSLVLTVAGIVSMLIAMGISSIGEK